ncbi:MAG: LacI family DNA-binding transcriptional regulator [Niabella sp.]
MNEEIPTIKLIAKRLNVSVSTVSRALNDHPRIGLRTKEAVKQMAKELNYEPNPKAIFFKQQKSYVIGVIVPHITEDFFSRSINGIEATAIENDYTILFGQSHDSVEMEENVLNAMKRQRVDGLIVSLSKETTNLNHFKALDNLNIPIVYFDRVPPANKVNKVYCNLYTGMVEMVEWLFANGRKKVAFINGPAKINASKERFEGYMEGISKRKLKVDMQMVEETDLSEKSTTGAMERLLALKKRPDAIITFNDYVHLDAVKYARYKGIKVNDEILFASFANISMNKYAAFPPVISVDQFPKLQGQKAMNLLIDLINKKNTDSKKSPSFKSIEIPAQLVVM